jgi:NTP pyrophosphatase (non-canonical NTP hydrolase)
MQDKDISAATLAAVRHFVTERDWDQFHNPKDMAISLSLEAAELLELFQWSGTDLQVQAKRPQMAEELADVFMYCIMLSQVLQLDPETIIKEKLAQNIKKYPVEKAYGSAKKYTEL